MGFFDFLFKKPKDEFDSPYLNGNNRNSNAGYDSYNAQYVNDANGAYQQNAAWQNNNAYVNPQNSMNRFVFRVDDVFTIRGRGTVVTGEVTYGTISVGDTVNVCRMNVAKMSTTVGGIEAFRKLLNTASQGDHVGILLGNNVTSNEVKSGDELRA